jgi:hypothetical protein
MAPFFVLGNNFVKGKLFPQLPRGLGETWEAAGLMQCNLHKKISAGRGAKLYKLIHIQS